jgi:uncharacterized protein (TIGR02391 family)
MDKKVRNLRAQLSRLKLLTEDLKKASALVYVEARDDFIDIITRIQSLQNEDLSFLYGNIRPFSDSEVQTSILLSKASQALAYLTECYADELGVAQTTLVTESLRDKQLRDRCIDLLIAEDNFDRAVSEATRVLEDRIRNKSGLSGSLSGGQLVNAAIKQERDKSVLVLSQDDGEQRGFADIMRGFMAAHRNRAHHFIYNMSRIDAASICAYIDVLLEIIDKSEVNKVQPS